jgi:hypothetical protein
VITLQQFLPGCGTCSALRPWQRAQILRLQQIVDTGHTLATALRVRDRNATTALIKRFRFLLSHQPNVSQAQHNAVKAYDNRLVGISKLQGTIAPGASTPSELSQLAPVSSG